VRVSVWPEPMRQKYRVRRGVKTGRADAGVIAKQKREAFFARRGVFFLTCPLMGDPNSSCFLNQPCPVFAV